MKYEVIFDESVGTIFLLSDEEERVFEENIVDLENSSKELIEAQVLEMEGRYQASVASKLQQAAEEAEQRVRVQAKIQDLRTHFEGVKDIPTKEISDASLDI